jgi:hypothetical protein
VQGQTLGSTLSTASTSLTAGQTPPATYTPLTGTATPTYGTSGTAVSTLQTQLNEQAKQFGIAPIMVDGKYGPQTQQLAQKVANTQNGSTTGSTSAGTGATTDPTTGNTTFPSGLVVDKNGYPVTPATKTNTAPPQPTGVTTDSTGGTTTTYDNGSTSYTPPTPEVSTAYTQANQATTTENANYENAVATAQAQLQQQITQNNQDKNNELSGAEVNYDAANPEGSGSDKGEYMASISSKWDTANSNLTSNATESLTQLAIQHTANLQNIQGQLSTALQTYTANQQSTGKDDYTEWEGHLAGDGTDDPTVGAQALMAQNTGNPAFTWDMAMSESQSAINKQAIATDKTLNDEDKANATLANTSFFDAMKNITTPFDQLPPAAQMGLVQKAIDAKLAPDATSAYALISTMNKSSIAANLQQQKQADAETRLAIAQEQANNTENKTSITDIQTFFKNSLTDNPNAFDDVKNMDSADQTKWVADTASSLHADPKQVLLALQFSGVKLTPATIKTVTSPVKFSVTNPSTWFGGNTTSTSTTTKGDASSASSSIVTAPDGTQIEITP